MRRVLLSCLVLLAVPSVSCFLDISDPLPGTRWENTATGAYGMIGEAQIFIIQNGEPVSEGQCYCDNQIALLISVRDGLTPPATILARPALRPHVAWSSTGVCR